jgi:hypothetical protein
MKTAARMFLGLAAFGVAGGTLYASLTKEYAGLFLFFMFAAANIFLSYLCIAAGDPEEVKRLAQERGEGEHHPMHLPPPSIWPFVIAVGAAVAGWGFLLKPPVVVVGLLIVLTGAAGWAGGFHSIDRDLAAWGEVWRYRQYKNLADIAAELEELEQDEQRHA